MIRNHYIHATAKPKLSILIPIYNASKYLHQSLDSATRQTIDDIEIICINDGSTDKSLDIIKKYTKCDKRITIIDKPNSGYGDSMNRGLAIARGEYVAILEPDDWYEPDMLSSLYQLATKYNLDVIKGDFYQYSNQTKHNRQYHLFRPGLCNKVLNSNQDTFIYSLQPSIWSAIYRRGFLNKNNIEFLDTPGASYQDTSFNFKVFALAKRAMFIDKPLLHYRIDNVQSSINNIAKKLPYIDKEYDEIDDFIIRHKLSDKLGATAIKCRYKTYLWAMEQLPARTLYRYAFGCSSKLRSSISLHGLSPSTESVYSLLIKHPMLYATEKVVKLSAHRAKLKICRR